MDIIINDQDGNQHTIHLYIEPNNNEIFVSGWESIGGYNAENGGLKKPTKGFKNNHEEENENEWVFDIKDIKRNE